MLFALLVLIGGASGWWLKGRALAGRVRTLEQQNADYGKRLGVAAREPPTYAKLTNEELRRAALQHAQNLRALHRDWLEALRARSTGLAKDAKATDEFSTEYAEDYGASGRALAVELKKRVPSPPADADLAAGELVLTSGILAGANPLIAAAAYLEGSAEKLK